jgi:F-box and leucine-rich repeat protein GRR1
MLISCLGCTSLTNESVRALSALPKLRRIGLVRVMNLTDQAVEHLTARYNTLERVHLSYCEQITVKAIHLLLQKLDKLTHLSLTGVPAFKKRDLQRFCRHPPSVSLHFVPTQLLIKMLLFRSRFLEL